MREWKYIPPGHVAIGWPSKYWTGPGYTHEPDYDGDVQNFRRVDWWGQNKKYGSRFKWNYKDEINIDWPVTPVSWSGGRFAMWGLRPARHYHLTYPSRKNRKNARHTSLAGVRGHRRGVFWKNEKHHVRYIGFFGLAARNQPRSQRFWVLRRKGWRIRNFVMRITRATDAISMPWYSIEYYRYFYRGVDRHWMAVVESSQLLLSRHMYIYSRYLRIRDRILRPVYAELPHIGGDYGWLRMLSFLRMHFRERCYWVLRRFLNSATHFFYQAARFIDTTERSADSAGFTKSVYVSRLHRRILKSWCGAAELPRFAMKRTRTRGLLERYVQTPEAMAPVPLRKLRAVQLAIRGYFKSPNVEAMDRMRITDLMNLFTSPGYREVTSSSASAQEQYSRGSDRLSADPDYIKTSLHEKPLKPYWCFGPLTEGIQPWINTWNVQGISPPYRSYPYVRGDSYPHKTRFQYAPGWHWVPVGYGWHQQMNVARTPLSHNYRQSVGTSGKDMLQLHYVTPLHIEMNAPWMDLQYDIKVHSDWRGRDVTKTPLYYIPRYDRTYLMEFNWYIPFYEPEVTRVDFEYKWWWTLRMRSQPTYSDLWPTYWINRYMRRNADIGMVHYTYHRIRYKTKFEIADNFDVSRLRQLSSGFSGSAAHAAGIKYITQQEHYRRGGRSRPWIFHRLTYEPLHTPRTISTRTPLRAWFKKKMLLIRMQEWIAFAIRYGQFDGAWHRHVRHLYTRRYWPWKYQGGWFYRRIEEVMLFQHYYRRIWRKRWPVSAWLWVYRRLLRYYVWAEIEEGFLLPNRQGRVHKRHYEHMFWAVIISDITYLVYYAPLALLIFCYRWLAGNVRRNHIDNSFLQLQLYLLQCGGVREFACTLAYHILALPANFLVICWFHLDRQLQYFLVLNWQRLALWNFILKLNFAIELEYNIAVFLTLLQI